jgi:cob(I)alamin adenosyltransferase
MSITTKKGDTGQTRLYSGEVVAKNCLEIECVGELDELVSMLGMAKAEADGDNQKRIIKQLQEWMFIVGSDIATKGDAKVRVTEDMMNSLDISRDVLEGEVGRITDFVIPGDSKNAACLDMARAICRRLERRLVANQQLDNSELLIRFINRLSDYLWLMARAASPQTTYRKK